MNNVNTPARVNGRFVSRKALAQDSRAVATVTRDEWARIIGARVQRLADKGETVAVEWAMIQKTIGQDSFITALALLVGAGAVETATLTRILPNDDYKSVGRVNYVQAKTCAKIVNMVHTLAANDLHKLSDYTSQVLFAALHNGDALSIAGAQASLSKRVSRIDLPNNEQVTNPANYTPGTASSQSSQVRDVLRILGIAEVNKGKKGDTFKLHADKVQRLRDLYAMGA